VDLWDLTRLIFRRWYFAMPILLVTLTGVLFASKNVRPDYSATGHLQMIPPAHADEPTGVKNGRIHNPWLDLGIQALGQATILKVQDERTVKQLGAAGYSETFTVTIDYPATFISIEGVGKTAQQATATVRQVMKLLADEVKAQQQQFGVAQIDMINTLPLDQGDKVTVITSKVKRVLIVATGMGLLTTAGSTIGLDALLRVRARRRKAAAQAAATAADGDGGNDRNDGGDDHGGASAVVPDQRVNGKVGEAVKAPAPGAPPEVRAPAQPARKKVGRVFGSKSAVEPATAPVKNFDAEETSVIRVPGTSERAASSENGHPPIVPEYRETADDAPEDRPMPSDATIVLPLSHKFWDVDDTGGKRR
jgi:hypothetical protein